MEAVESRSAALTSDIETDTDANTASLDAAVSVAVSEVLFLLLESASIRRSDHVCQ
jgi:hypothetical protein